MKKILIALLTLSASLALSSCNSGVSASDLNNHSLSNTYLYFAIVDQESTLPNLSSEIYWANIAIGGYDTYSPLPGFLATYSQVALGNGEQFSTTVTSASNASENYVLTQIFLASKGFYDYTNNNPTTIPNENSYQLTLNYRGNTYSTALPSVKNDYVYTINSASCQFAPGNTSINSCTVTTNNSVGQLPSDAQVSYALNITNLSNNGGGFCKANLNSSNIGSDSISFSSCTIQPGAILQLQMTITYTLQVASAVSLGESSSLQTQAQYIFNSKNIAINY